MAILRNQKILALKMETVSVSETLVSIYLEAHTALLPRRYFAPSWELQISYKN
jgi:hypothetical protein